MMKKHGFTLAEVLITLAIIGVVATLTLPSLMSNTAEQQSTTAYKKLLNTLTEAGQMSAALEGIDYSGVSGIGNYADRVRNNNMTLAGILHDRLQVNETIGNTTYATTSGTNHCGNGVVVFTLRDGTGVCLTAQGEGQTDFLNIWVDTNGPKGPNRESTCNEEGCTTRNQKHINDQFSVVLYQGSAYPGHWNNIEAPTATNADFAARYAMGTSVAGAGGNGS